MDRDRSNWSYLDAVRLVIVGSQLTMPSLPGFAGAQNVSASDYGCVDMPVIHQVWLAAVKAVGLLRQRVSCGSHAGPNPDEVEDRYDQTERGDIADSQKDEPNRFEGNPKRLALAGPSPGARRSP